MDPARKRIVVELRQCKNCAPGSFKSRVRVVMPNEPIDCCATTHSLAITQVPARFGLACLVRSSRDEQTSTFFWPVF